MNLKDFMRTLDTTQRKRFAVLAGTTTNHLYQLRGGHRRGSLQLLWRMVLASRKLNRDPARWLTLDEMHLESERIRARRMKTIERIGL